MKQSKNSDSDPAKKFDKLQGVKINVTFYLYLIAVAVGVVLYLFVGE